jgi:AraC-like DNA-binding protein
MMEAPDVETALSGFKALQPSNSRGASVYLRRAGADVVFGYGIYDRTATDQAQAYAMAMAVAVNVLRGLTEGAMSPSEVLFSFRAPKNSAPFRAFFGAPLRFDQYETGIVLSQQALKTPIKGSGKADLEFWRQRALAIAPPSRTFWTDRVRHTLRPLLLEGKASAPGVAARLGLDVRTLSRRLEGEGRRFQEILDDVRFAAARELLALTELHVGDIADALSYATQGAFVVAFRRWAGLSPSGWRKANAVWSPRSP